MRGLARADGDTSYEREAAAQANDAPASIVVVQNWFEELKRRVPTN